MFGLDMSCPKTPRMSFHYLKIVIVRWKSTLYLDIFANCLYLFIFLNVHKDPVINTKINSFKAKT